MSRDASPTQSGSPDVPGYAAEKPREIPPGGWFQILRRSLKEVRDDHLTLIAGGVAYSWFLALFPGLIAAVLVYGMVRDTTTGDPRPIGTRGAVKADEPPPTS